MATSLSASPPSLSLRARVAAWGRGVMAWVVPPALPSYARAREDLGDVPWRRFENTDAWYVGASAEVRADRSLPVVLLDSVPNLRAQGLGKPAWLVVAGAGLVSLVLVLALARPGSTPPKATAIVLPPAAAGPAAATTPVVAQSKQIAARAQSPYGGKKHLRAGKRHAPKVRGTGA